MIPRFASLVNEGDKKSGRRWLFWIQWDDNMNLKLNIHIFRSCYTIKEKFYGIFYSAFSLIENFLFPIIQNDQILS